MEGSLSSAMLRFLCLPNPTWPQDLDWDCLACGSKNKGDGRPLCAHCSATTRSRSWALKHLLDRMSTALLVQLEGDTASEVREVLPLDLLLYVLLSPHNNNMTGLTCGSYSLEAAIECRCLEDRDESPKLASAGEEGQVPLFSEDSEKLLESLDEGSFDGSLDEKLLDSHDGSRLEDSLPVELASLTVSLPLDVTRI